MRLRHFYKINNSKQPIPGSNIKRKSSPGKLWKEITLICCDPDVIDCTCGPRFFVQLDAGKNPVPGTLIKRDSWPKMEQGINYQEIQWKPTCCIIPSTPVTVNSTACGITWNNCKVQFYTPDGLTLLAETASNLDADPQLVNVPIVIGGYIVKFNWLADAFPGVDEGFEVWEGAAVSGTMIINQFIIEGTIPPQTYPSLLRPALVPVYSVACAGGS